MKHLDLFSGIGGASLALDRVFGKVEHIFVENDPFCQEALKKHWPEATYFGDIRKFTADTYFNGRTGGNKEIDSADPRLKAQRLAARRNKPPFILTGGFPCQPFSQAGRRKGKDDDRFLWYEMLRVIKEFKPTWIVGENVAGLLSMVQYESNLKVDSSGNPIGTIGELAYRKGSGLFLEILETLEEAGYEVQPFVIPAVAVNAPHRRDRVWIIANRTSERFGTGSDNREGRQILQRGQDTGGRSRKGDVADSERKGYAKQEHKARQSTRYSRGSQSPDWSTNWLEVASRFCKLDDELPNRLFTLPSGKTIKGSRWRNESLKALGNAWVPAVAEEIFNAIKTVEHKPKIMSKLNIWDFKTKPVLRGEYVGVYVGLGIYHTPVYRIREANSRRVACLWGHFQLQKFFAYVMPGTIVEIKGGAKLIDKDTKDKKGKPKVHYEYKCRIIKKRSLAREELGRASVKQRAAAKRRTNDKDK